MHKTVQHGFSLLELMIVLALLGLLGAFAVPNLFKIKQGAERKDFIAAFQMILKDCVTRSIIQNKMHQIFIDIEHEVIQMREFDPTSIETHQHKKFKKVEEFGYVTEIKFLKRFVIRNFFINHVDEVTPGNAMLNVSFYIMQDGTSQAIVANFIDQDVDGIMPDVQFSCLINPFYARVSMYDTFQTP